MTGRIRSTLDATLLSGSLNALKPEACTTSNAKDLQEKVSGRLPHDAHGAGAFSATVPVAGAPAGVGPLSLKISCHTHDYSASPHPVLCSTMYPFTLISISPRSRESCRLCDSPGNSLTGSVAEARLRVSKQGS